MTLVPLYDNIIVKPIKAVEKTASGLYLANADTNAGYATAEVVAVGQGYKHSGIDKLFPLTVKIGDTVIYRKAVDIPVDSEGVEMFLISEANVLAIKN